MRRYAARAATDALHALGEGILWDEASGVLRWVDITNGTAHSALLDGQHIGRADAVVLDDTVGAVACAVDGGLLIAGSRDLITVDPQGRVTGRIPLIPDGRASRLNDGAVDPAGRFLVGTLALGATAHDERLYRIDADRSVTQLRDDLGQANGIGWSPDGGTIYVVDTVPGTVWCADYDLATGQPRNWSPLLSIDDGFPDGLTVDADGRLWIAIWGAGEVRCYSSAGVLEAAVEVAAPQVSSQAFCGPDLDVLVITTARQDLSAQELRRHPHSGALFVASVDAVGLEAPRWAGGTAAAEESGG
jgi:sugar lactone lactonase YvrE